MMGFFLNMHEFSGNNLGGALHFLKPPRLQLPSQKKVIQASTVARHKRCVQRSKIVGWNMKRFAANHLKVSQKSFASPGEPQHLQ